MKKILISIFTVFFIIPTMITFSASAVVISGRVFDEKKQPLIGAHVVPEKNTTTNIGAATDSNGNYEIKNFPDGEKVVISYIGYETQTLSISDAKNVTLKETSYKIDTVTVTSKAGDPCTEGSQMKNATSGTLQKNDKNGLTCIPDKCVDGFEVIDQKCIEKKESNDDPKAKTTPDQTEDTDESTDASNEPEAETTPKQEKPKLSKEQQQQRIAELQKNADDMKAKENSLANKTLGAASMGATGIGASMLMQGKAEQKADEQAENDMRAYLETIRCDYGQGQNFKNGETGITLPGGNDLYNYYNEYVALADSLKTTKTALNLQPGIESEAILDKATSGLYDNAAIGKTGGAFTSLSQALSGDAAAAAAWDAQKAESASRTKTGAITAGAGIIGGAIGNIAINSGKNVPKERSKEINRKYDNLLKNSFGKLEKEINDGAKKQCSEFSGTTGVGTIPSCQCQDPNHRFTEEGCVACPGDKVYDATNKCVCPEDKPVDKGDNVCVVKSPSCQLTGAVNTATCKCKDTYLQDGDRCYCPDEGYTDTDNECRKNEAASSEGTIIDSIIPQIALAEPEKPIFTAKLDASNLFATNEAKLLSAAETKIDNFIKTDLPAELKKANLSEIDYSELCISIIGHTDRTKFKNDPDNSKNYTLSKNRAKTVANRLQSGGSGLKIDPANIDGVGPDQCTNPPYRLANNPKCRRVDINVYAGECPIKK